MTLNEKLEHFTKWWERKNERPLLNLVIIPEPAPDLNRFWPTPEDEPDFAEMVQTQLQWTTRVLFPADMYSCIPHSWGSRGTPMTMAAYLGGRVNFSDTTVWIEPVIDNWSEFRISFNSDNPWVKKSRNLMENQITLCPENCLPELPDLGDALTVFSLLRGTQRLLVDLTEQPETIEQKTREYNDIWTEAHRYFWDIYRSRFPGDCSNLVWAPGKTYICQSDFSTMISPAMFRRFVVPEIEQLSGYLEYMPWHLDGPEEIKHLDILLELPAIRAIQVQPGTNRPPCASPLWLPQAKKIQKKNRSIMVSANTPEELETLLTNLEPEGLYISLNCSFINLEEAAPFLKVFKHRYGKSEMRY